MCPLPNTHTHKSFMCVLSIHKAVIYVSSTGDFPRAWSLLLDHIELSALCRNAEVSLAALKSFQEILQISRAVPSGAANKAGDGTEDDSTQWPAAPGVITVEPPAGEVINRTGEASAAVSPSGSAGNRKNELYSKGNISDSSDDDIPLWSAAWKVWLNIGAEVTKPPPNQGGEISSPASMPATKKVYLPSQQFLTALIQTFPPLFEHIRSRFHASDLQKLSTVLKGTLCVPVQSDSSPFIVPSYPEVTLTPLQVASLAAMDTLIKVMSIQSDPVS